MSDDSEGSDLDLDAIEARAKAATPGPWTATAFHVLYKHPSCNRVAETGAVADTAFIAHARTDVPALIARVRELEALALTPGQLDFIERMQSERNTAIDRAERAERERDQMRDKLEALEHELSVPKGDL